MTRYRRVFARAFTLSEAVTAAAVIALSASIVLPTLAKTKESARRAMCADNMHHLMAGVLSYASDHTGKGPMRGWFTYTVAEPMKEVYGWGGYSTKVLANLGQLHKKWIGGQHDMLYCPSTYATVRDSSSGWKTAFNPAVTYTVGSYNYALPVAHRSDPSGPGKSPVFSGPNPFPPDVWAADFTDWTLDQYIYAGKGWHAFTGRPLNEPFQMPSSPALAFDWWVGGFTPVHSPYVNVMYPDGHVRFHDIGSLSVTSGGSNPQRYEIWYKLSLRQ